jgi:hypothetical protein
MNVHEIVRKLRHGEKVSIPADYAMEFMRECERHGETIRCGVEIVGGMCTLTPDDYQEGGARRE